MSSATALNTVGKRDHPGERVRCVVSVGMLTEGWDAKTVTHVVGFRRFGTQLICEQVSGRALRRVAHDADEHGYLYPEYADILGIPFDNLGPGRESSDRDPPAPLHTTTFTQSTKKTDSPSNGQTFWITIGPKGATP